MEEYIAHIREDGTKQFVKEHCENVSVYASENLSSLNLSSVGKLIGLLHDAGKMKEEFNRYIIAAYEGKNPRRGSVNHTFAGVRIIFELLEQLESNIKSRISTEIMAYAIGAHHGQFDCLDLSGNDGFEHRLDENNLIGYEEAKKEFFKNVIDEEELKETYKKACNEISDFLDLFQKLDIKSDGKCKVFFCLIGNFVRLIQSALIDADRRDTAEFMDNSKQNDLLIDIESFWEKQVIHFENEISKFDNVSKINKARMQMSDECYKASKLPCGIYRVNMPTGAGKTLSTLRYALSHAKTFSKKRIIYVFPLLTILEQNAEVIKKYISDSEMILEHHSNVVDINNNYDELNIKELLLENWKSPIIITTLVQLLETFFSGKTSSIRRFSSLADSIIVIDEVQSVPTKMLALFNQMITFLSEYCNTTIVLCSATQPELESDSIKYPIKVDVKDIVEYDKNLWNVFKRTNVEFLGSSTLSKVPDKLLDIISKNKSVLIICNKKSESEFIYNELSRIVKCYHISASMCVNHRKKIFEKIKNGLSHNDTPIVCISTQVMEAGVDLSFSCVVRFMAGIDSVVQAAGRCNRNGEFSEVKNVYMINCTDENLQMLSEIKKGKDSTEKLLYKYEKNPELYKKDIISDQAIKDYYNIFYQEISNKTNYTEYYLKSKKRSIFSMLSDNIESLNSSNNKHLLKQAFKEAGRAFKVFDDDTLSVIVPYGRGKEIINEMCSDKVKFDYTYLNEVISKAKEFTVTLYPYQAKKLLDEKAIYLPQEDSDILLLKNEYYNDNTGVILENITLDYMEV